MSDDLPDERSTEPDQDSGQVSSGGSSLGQGPEQLGGADAVPDTPDKNFPEDGGAAGRGTSAADESPS